MLLIVAGAGDVTGTGAETGGAGCDCVVAASTGGVGETSERVPVVVLPAIEDGSVGDGDPELGAGAGDAGDTSDTGSDIASVTGFESPSLGVSAVPSVVDSGPGDDTSPGPAGGEASSVAGGRTSPVGSGMTADARADSEETSGRGHGWDTEPAAANAVGSMVGAAGNSPSASARDGRASTATVRAVTATGRRQPDLAREGRERCVSTRKGMCEERNTQRFDVSIHKGKAERICHSP